MTAYRKKHSCVTALISWVEDWRLALDNKQKALLLSMDMSKAFDLVLPSLTVAKLGAYGFNDKSLQLMRSYFKDRLNRQGSKLHLYRGHLRIKISLLRLKFLHC